MVEDGDLLEEARQSAQGLSPREARLTIAGIRSIPENERSPQQQAQLQIAEQKLNDHTVASEVKKQ